MHELIVVGAGLSGSEVALGAARRGLETLLITTSLDTVYNVAGPSVTLTPPPGSVMAELCGAAEKPVAANRFALHRDAKKLLEHESKLHLLQSSVSALLTDGERVTGVATWEGVDRRAPEVVLAVGSFLQARLSIGALTETSGRLSEMAYDDLYNDLLARGFAFEPVHIDCNASSGSLPYTVAARRFSEWEAETFRLPRLSGLYAVGVCAAGYLSYEDAAAQGQRLAQILTNRSGARG